MTLTPRQRQVCALVAQGHANKEIACRLGMTTGTVKEHLNTVYHILKLANRTELAIYWIENRMNHETNAHGFSADLLAARAGAAR